MARDALTGSRIRERRTMAGLKQAELAQQLGISASYLNLIEHNRRRIGGKLLMNIADVLDVEAQLLTEGAEATLLATLREAGEERGLSAPEAARADEFAGRFPGWADVLAGTRAQVTDLERTIEALNDRIAHDPFLADSMHELLSTAAAVRSTAAILAETKTLRPEWRDRFHANIDEDSRRLSESAQALVNYLDVKGAEGAAPLSPVEEVSAFLTAHSFSFEALEQPGADDKTVAEMVRAAPMLVSQSARNTGVNVLSQIIRDAAQLALPDLRAALALRGLEPIRLAEALGCPVAVVLRRLAALPEVGGTLVAADRAGSTVFRTAALDSGVEPPQSLIFAALGTSGLVARDRIARADAVMFDCFATCEPAGPARYNVAPAVQCVLLMVPVTDTSLAPPDAVTS